MDHYHLNNNAQTSGEKEVHKESCRYFPSDKTYLGYFSNCQDALQKAKTVFWNVDGCIFCCPACHKK